MFDISRFRQYISDIFNEVSYVLLEMETEFCPSGSFPRKFSCVLENEQTSSSASGVRDALLPDSGTGEGSGYRLRGRFFYRVDAAPRAGGALLREVFRVLRPGGTFAVCCDSSNPETAKRYTDRIHGMKVYTPAELCAFLSGAGFSEVEAHCDPASEIVCVTGRK